MGSVSWRPPNKNSIRLSKSRAPIFGDEELPNFEGAGEYLANCTRESVHD